MKKFLLISAITISFFTAFTQNKTCYWYFGEYAGIYFGNLIPVALTDGAINTGEGSSSISTEDGNLLFYTNGQFVYDRNHDQMPHGSGLLGHHSSTQSAVIVPKPMSTTDYYIFTVDAYDNGLVEGLRYSLVDMTLNDGLGDVVESEKNIPLLPYACEKVSAVLCSDGISFWVLAHQWGTDAFCAYQVTSQGVDQTPVISNTGPVLTGEMQASKGFLKFSPDGSKIAMANNTAYSISIFQFNNTSGIVTHLVTDNNYSAPGGVDPGGPYGVEFSPNNQLLYISEWKLNRKIYQYDLSSENADLILSSRIIVANVGQNDYAIGALQLGQDSKIYVARLYSPYLSRIEQPNIPGSGCSFVDNAFGLDGMQSNYGLPNFVQSFFKLLDADFTGIPLKGAAPLSVRFTDESDGNPTTWKWDFQNDGIYDAFIQNPSFTYTQVGKYPVKLFIQNSSEVDSVIKLDYVSVGLNCDFSALPDSGQAPLNVQFFDESIGIPTVWKWDFQNDGIFDAFIQNPTFYYADPGVFSVKLVVINASQADSVVKENYITIMPGSNSDGLVGYYPFNGNANDESGNGYNGLVYGATLTSDRFGNTDAAYSFDGNSDYISSNLYNLPTLSISFWFKSPAPENEWPDFLMYNNLRSQLVGEGQTPYGFVQARKQISQDQGFEALSNYAPEFDLWHHVYMEWTSSNYTLKLYIDGLFQNTGSITNTGEMTATNNNIIFFGAAADLGQNNFLTGSLDDIRIYNRTLSEDEILALYEESANLTPQVCIVSVTPDDHNKVIWEKAPSLQADTINIYRETALSNVYALIGSVAYEDSCIFTDLNSNPQLRSYKYKLSAVSNSGFESGLSNYHRTIHLAIEQGPMGWNLLWSPYEGFPFDIYYIYRGDNLDMMNILDSVSGYITSYSDIQPPPGPLYYAIEIVNEEGCNPGKNEGYDRSRSNIAFNNEVGITVNVESGIKIYPNPAHDLLYAEFNQGSEEFDSELFIYDLQGHKIKSHNLDSKKTRIELNDLNPGVYVIKIICNKTILRTKMILF